MGNGGWSVPGVWTPPTMKAEPASARKRPPAVAGVSPSTLVLPLLPTDAPVHNLLSFLEQTMPISYGPGWSFRFEHQQVLAEDGRPLALDAAYAPGQRIYYYRHVVHEPRVPFDEQILYQDEHLLVADKPHFLPVTPTGRYVQETLLVRLKKRTGLDDLAPIHRIDRDTAGLVLFSVQAGSRGAYMREFRERRVHKVYEAIAGRVARLSAPGDQLVHTSRLEDHPDSFMQMREVAGPANSETRITLLEHLPQGLARYRLEPVTGKRHQLRVHMMQQGAPIMGDGIYPHLLPEPDVAALDYSHPLQLLARSLELTDPMTGQVRRFSSTRQLTGL